MSTSGDGLVVGRVRDTTCALNIGELSASGTMPADTMGAGMRATDATASATMTSKRRSIESLRDWRSSPFTAHGGGNTVVKFSPL
mmetsp:Transcript_42686/g.118833  ORF Transcript_42686/g.118833 Transcript_42686/m.118833 type:complete len:85 (-) Transcript_42686:547-801(-)